MDKLAEVASEAADRQEIEQLRKRSFWQFLHDQLYGYDFFISYRWSDGRRYALELVKHLKARGIDCFLDSEDFRPGQNWLLGGRAALQNTSRLVLLASRDAVRDPIERSAEDDPILNELRAFERSNRQKVRVQLYPLDDEEWEEAPVSGFFSSEDIYLSDLENDVEVVVNELSRWSRMDKRDRKRMRAFQLVALSLLVLTFGVVTMGAFAWVNSGKLRAAAAATLFQNGNEKTGDSTNLSAAQDLSSALELDPGNSKIVDRVFSMMVHGTPQWTHQRRITHTQDIVTATMNQDASAVAFADADGNVFISDWNGAKKGMAGRLPGASRLRFDVSNGVLVAGTAAGQWLAWSLETGKEVGLPDADPADSNSPQQDIGEADEDYEEDEFADEDPEAHTDYVSPDETWTVTLTYNYGDFQAHQFPYYRVRISDQAGHAFDKLLKVVDVSFDDKSSYVIVELNTGGLFIFDRAGRRTEIEHQGHSAVGFDESGEVAYTNAARTVRFWSLGETKPMPAPAYLASSPLALDLARDSGHWFMTSVHGSAVSLWAYPVSPAVAYETHKTTDFNPRNWQEKARTTNDRSWKVDGNAGEWQVVHSSSLTSKWPLLKHPLSDRDANEAAYKDESFVAPIASIITGAAISGDGNVVVTSAGRSNPKIWRAGHDEAQAEIEIESGRYVDAVKLDVHGRSLFVHYSGEGVGGLNPAYGLYSIRDGRLLGEGTLVETLVDVSSDCRRILVQTSYGNRHLLKVFDVVSGTEIGEPIELEDIVSAVLSHDGTRFVTAAVPKGEESGFLRVYDAAAKIPLSQQLDFPTVGAGYGKPWFSQDGNFVNLAELGKSQKVLVWQAHVNLTARGAKRLSRLSRQYYGIGTPSRQAVPDILKTFGGIRNSEVAMLAKRLFPDVTPTANR